MSTLPMMFSTMSWLPRQHTLHLRCAPDFHAMRCAHATRGQCRGDLPQRRGACSARGGDVGQHVGRPFRCESAERLTPHRLPRLTPAEGEFMLFVHAGRRFQVGSALDADKG